MEVVYNEYKVELASILRKINPLDVVTDVERLVGNCNDLMSIDEENKLEIKKDYRNWCKKNHPDKDENVKEDSIYLFKEL